MPESPRRLLIACLLVGCAIWRVAFINKDIALTFLLVAYASVQLTALRRGRAGWWIGAGALLGVVNLCKPTFLLWPLVLLPLARRDRVRPAQVGALVLAATLVILPWALRNYRVTQGEVLPIATENGGLTTFVGNYQPTHGLWEGPGKPEWMAAVDEVRRRHPGASVVELDRAFYRAAWDQIRSNPPTAMELAVRKLGRFWFLSAARRAPAASLLIQGLWLAFGAVGLWILRPWSPGTRLMLGLVLYVMAIHALTYADLRFSLPVAPFVAAFGGEALRAAAQRRGPHAGSGRSGRTA